MMPTQKKILAVSGLVLVIAISSVWIWRGLGSSRPMVESPEQEWECAKCGAIFRAEMPLEYLRPPRPGASPTRPRCKCPRCGASAHLRMVIRCLGCGTVFMFNQAYLEPGGSPDGAAGRGAVALRCVNARCERLRPRHAPKKPQGKWKKCRCTACGRTFDVLGQGSDAPCSSYRCLDQNCGSDEVTPAQ